MNCKDFHIEVEEALKGDSLSIAGQDHAASCHPCREFNQKHIEFREWLMVCEKITAPKNFGFGVQRKIASSSAAHSHNWAWRLRYIVPSTALAAVLVLAGSYVFNNQTVTDTRSATALEAEKQDQVTANEPAKQTDNSTIAQSSGPVEPSKQDVGKIASANSEKQDNNSRVELPKGGSSDSAAKPGEKPKTPEGINLSGNNSSLNRSKTLIALKAFGAITGVADMIVKQVTENSPAARSGIKVGDVVESLNGNVLTIKRGSQTMQITIQ